MAEEKEKNTKFPILLAAAMAIIGIIIGAGACNISLQINTIAPLQEENSRLNSAASEKCSLVEQLRLDLNSEKQTVHDLNIALSAIDMNRYCGLDMNKVAAFDPSLGQLITPAQNPEYIQQLSDAGYYCFTQKSGQIDCAPILNIENGWRCRKG